MFLVFKTLLALAVAGVPSWAAGYLRVCADPNNLPFSNSQEQGFENALAQLVAHDLGLTVRYVWAPQRGRFFRQTLGARRCDVVMGVPSSLAATEPTHPYYRSSYVFVWRQNSPFAVRSFDAPLLRHARIGVQVIGDDGNTVPPAQALIDRGLVRNIAWYKLYPDFTMANPPSSLIEAVARGEIDLAVAWGPLAGYFARQSSVPLRLAPVSPQYERTMPLAFDISMGVRHGDAQLLAALNGVIERRRLQIRRLLREYGVPLVEGGDSHSASNR